MRIDNKTYGISPTTGKLTPKERLRADKGSFTIEHQVMTLVSVEEKSTYQATIDKMKKALKTW
jgi:hypothetical protein